MFAKRNSITLAAIWLILIIIGVFWYVKDTKSLVNLMKDQIELSTTLKSSQQEIKRLVNVETTHTDLRDKWLNASKRIISADEPAFSLSYINWIMSKNQLPIDFDFALNSSNQLSNHTTFVYTLSGEGRYYDILKLIWYLTYEPILYQINSIEMKRTDEEVDLLQFDIKLEGYSVESDLELEEYSELSPTDKVHQIRKEDIFEPLVRKPKPVAVYKARPKPTLPPKLPGQIDVQKATLKAVTSNSIFISENKGELVELKPGAQVYLGRLLSINQSTNEATFRITKFGKSQIITLRLDYKN